MKVDRNSQNLESSWRKWDFVLKEEEEEEEEDDENNGDNEETMRMMVMMMVMMSFCKEADEEEEDEQWWQIKDDDDRGTTWRPLKMISNLFHSWLVVVFVGILCFHLYFHWGFLWCLSTTHDHRSVGRKIAAEGKSWWISWARPWKYHKQVDYQW